MTSLPEWGGQTRGYARRVGKSAAGHAPKIMKTPNWPMTVTHFPTRRATRACPPHSGREV